MEQELSNCPSADRTFLSSTFPNTHSLAASLSTYYDKIQLLLEFKILEMNLENIILILILFILCSYVIVKSSILYNLKHASLIIFFLFLHTLGLFLQETIIVIPVICFIGGAMGVFLTYFNWFIKKRRKRIVDYLKLIWLLLFVFIYLYTNITYNTLSSEKGPHVLAGLNNSLRHIEIIKLQYIYISLIVIISLLIYKETNHNRREMICNAE